MFLVEPYNPYSLLTISCLAGLSKKKLRNLLGEAQDRPVLDARKYKLPGLTLSVVTGLTLDHSRILLGFCLSYGENHADTKFLLQFLLANGGESINSPENIILSDRGNCASPIDEVFSSAIHHYCPKHLERNLKGKKYSDKIIAKFWAARCAKDEKTYKKLMKEMEGLSIGCALSGKDAADYLRGIPHWQLYVIVAKKAVLYELKSDNLVEGMFATLKEARCQASPIFACSDIISRALATVRAAEVIAMKTEGELTIRAIRISNYNYEKSLAYSVEQLSGKKGEGKYKVRRPQGEPYTVNIAAKTCTCHHWQQSGVPCYHAWRAIASTNSRGSICMHPKYYYEFCHSTRVKAMFDDYAAMDSVNFDDVESLASVNTYPTILPRTSLVGLTTRVITDRMSGADDTKKKGVSKAAIAKSKQTICPQCGKSIASGNESHAYNHACFAYSSRHKTGSLFANDLITPYYTARAAVLETISEDVFDSDDSSTC